ncbi:MAG TPA: HNH endonuclease [Clostridium sp.]|nr:HNH endonuclease [Clostridium sp.]
MSNKYIINENNSLIEDFEDNQIHIKDITSSIITNPYGAITLPYDGSVDLNSFSRILEENLSSSYKIFWFFGIYEEIIKGNKYISFRKLVCRMIVGAWYPVTQYKLSLGIQDRLFDLVILIHEKYNIPCDMNKNKLLEVIENIEDVEVEKRIKTLHDYVPYRLLTPFFAKELALTKDIFKKNDYERNKFIARLTKEDERAIYKIDVDNKVIEINDSWYKYIRANQTIICGWMHYNLVCYLQKRNPNVPAIPFKITAPGKRDLSKATKLWTEINRDKTVSDIYTGKELTEENFSNYGNLSIDHFIPWSFVLHDELWNLAPTFKNVNSQKSNKLPDLSLYMDKFCEIQYKSFYLMQRNPKRYKKHLEGYLSINIAANNERKIEKEEFNQKLKANIEPLYQIAFNQGYGVWER